MNLPVDDANIQKLRETVLAGARVVVLTGAGLSAESGIPTYRGRGGLWTKYDPDRFASYDYFIKDPSYFWGFFRDLRFPIMSQAKPNPAHLALAELEHRRIVTRVITQNIDGIHQLAGSKNVCELHGNTRQIICLDCQQKISMEEARELLAKVEVPRCKCGGLLKPDVVMFGEPLPSKALLTAYQAAQACDSFWVIGSSLQVYPAAQIPLVAKESGASLVIINLDPTPLDGAADLVLNLPASQVLSALIV